MFGKLAVVQYVCEFVWQIGGTKIFDRSVWQIDGTRCLTDLFDRSCKVTYDALCRKSS